MSASTPSAPQRLERFNALSASTPSRFSTLPRPWRIATVATVHLLQFLKCVARGIGRYHFYRAIVWAHHLRTLAPSRFDALSAQTMPREPWEETPGKFAKRVSQCTAFVDANHAVPRLCMQFPDRLEELANVSQGDGLRHWNCLADVFVRVVEGRCCLCEVCAALFVQRMCGEAEQP